jgi:hypothetical protein
MVAIKPKVVRRKPTVKPVTEQVVEERVEPVRQRSVSPVRKEVIAKVQPVVIEPAKGIVIAPPKIELPPPPPSDVFDLAQATMTDLIRHKFPEGRLSGREIARREELKTKKRKKPEVKAVPEVKEVKKRSIPKLMIRDGKMVIDHESMQVDEEVIDEDANVIEEDAVTRYVTSASFRSKHKLVTPKWTPQMTQRFYDVHSAYIGPFLLWYRL